MKNVARRFSPRHTSQHIAAQWKPSGSYPRIDCLFAYATQCTSLGLMVTNWLHPNSSNLTARQTLTLY